MATNADQWKSRQMHISACHSLCVSLPPPAGTADGYYIHIEASWFARGSIAVLESPYMMPPQPGKVCTLSFWYHMFGGDCGSLMVFVNGGDELSLRFKETGDHGDKWIKATVPLNSSFGYRVHLVASRGNSFKGKREGDHFSATSLTYEYSVLTST